MTSQRHVFVLMGQSNMAGRGELADGDRTPVPGVYVLDGQASLDDPRPASPTRWRSGAHPLHLNEPHKNQFGLGLAFAQRYRERRPGVEIGLVPCAWGGQPLARLGPGSVLYEDTVRRAEVATESGRLIGVLWHQGESETGSEEAAATYGTRLKSLVTDLRQRLRVPRLLFVVGDLAHSHGRDADPGRLGRIAQVRAGLAELAEHDRRAGWVSSVGLETAEDGTHFTRDALGQFGVRYADVVLEVDR